MTTEDRQYLKRHGWKIIKVDGGWQGIYNDGGRTAIYGAPEWVLLFIQTLVGR